MSDKILLIAGEVSGDHHAAELVKALKEQAPRYSYYGIGGDDLREQGMNLFYHVSDMAFLGIGEIIKHLPFIRRVMKQIMDWAKKEKPRCVILVDYPGFNLRLAARLKKAGITVVYYISPQLWAWGKRRVHKIKRDVDLMLVLFPFEKKFYNGYGIDAHYVGHPLVDKHTPYLPGEEKKLRRGEAVVGLLPGSRRQEVHTLLPTMLRSVRDLQARGKISSVEIIRVEHLPEDVYRHFFEKTDDAFISLKKTPLKDVLPTYDAVAVASGTATLECAFYAVPMVIVYHVSALTYWLGRLLVKVPFIGLANIVAEKQVAPELIQADFNEKALTKEIEKILEPAQNKFVRAQLKEVRHKLGNPGASRRAANEIAVLLEQQK